MSEVDANIDLIKKIETVLSIYIRNDSVSQISNSIVKILNDYDISYRSTSVIPYDTFNDQILKYYKGCLRRIIIHKFEVVRAAELPHKNTTE